MSRKTELATIYRELTVLRARMWLVGAYEAERKLTEAMVRTMVWYRKEVERIAREAAMS